MNDLVSVIVPIYNSEKYLKKCVESIQGQTYRNLEIILVNDGSIDGSLDIMQELKEKDDRIVIVNRENKGVLYTRVEGFKIAKGKYITFVDSDDWVEINYVEKMHDVSIRNNSDVVKCAFKYNNSENYQSKVQENTYIPKEKFEPIFYKMLFEDMDIHTVWAQLFKKDKLKDIEQIDVDISLGDDLEFNMQLYKNIDSIEFIPDALYHYRLNSNSITHRNTEKNIKQNIDSVTKSYFNACNVINELNLKNKDIYIISVLNKLIDEVIKWQIDLIGVVKNKKECIDYLQWYYNENELAKLIITEHDRLDGVSKKLKYNIFYKEVFINMNKAYFIGLAINKLKKILRKLKYRSFK